MAQRTRPPDVRRSRCDIGPLHEIITSQTYKREIRFNPRVWKTRGAKPEAEQIMVPVEPIIDEETFDQVQAALEAGNPKVMPPRTVTGPILLTGIPLRQLWRRLAIRTGKSGRYRYYTCAASAQKGKAA